MKLKFCIHILFWMSFHSILFSQTSKQNVNISGTILNFHNQMQVEDISEFQELDLPTLDRTFLPNSSGHFNISFQIEKPNYFRIGRNILYLTPGDSLDVIIDFMYPEKAKIQGNKASSIEANIYLESIPYPKEGSFLMAGENVKKSIEETIDYILNIGNDRILKLIKLENITSEFKRIEKIRINADIANSILFIKTYYSWKYKIEKDSLKSFLTNADKIIKPYVIKYLIDDIDPQYLKLPVYRNVLPYIFDSLPKNSNYQVIREYYNAWTLVSKMKKMDNKNELKELLPKIEVIKNTEYKESVYNSFNRLMALNNGDSAVDLRITSKSGKKVKLSDFKGKLLYIDIWATWCGPCLEELPYLDSLRNKFRDNKNIEFISLSIDDEYKIWKKYLDENKIKSNQWIIDREFLKVYNVITIPRVIIINKDFTIAYMNGELPSSNKINLILTSLVK